jgi:putative acetyltransferase
MYVKPEHRGKGVSKLILVELENWARESGFTQSIPETGFKQPEVIGLYSKSDYSQIKNYGQHAAMPKSICFSKTIKK